MLAFSNENIKDMLCGGCDCTGFTPSVTYVISSNTLTITDASTYPAGDDRKILRVAIHDKQGGKVVAAITQGDGDDAQAVSIAALNRAEGIDMLITIVTQEGCISDGHASNLGASGSAGYFDFENSSLTVGGSATS